MLAMAEHLSRDLTCRQVVILRLIYCGLTDKEVACRLGIDEETVSNHLRKAFNRLGVHARGQAIGRALALGYDLHG